MKSRGSVNWQHGYAWALMHLSDAKKQRIQKGGQGATRLVRTLTRIADRIERKRRRKPKKGDGSKQTPGSLRFPTLEHGVSTIRTNVGGQWPGMVPPPGLYEILGKNDEQRIEDWVFEVGDWHSGYPTPDGVQFFKTPSSKKPGVKDDYRFFYSTHTLPVWDTVALAESMAAGEITKADLTRIYSCHDQWCETEGARLASCGATRPLVYTGCDWHLEDGSVHAHPRFLKTLPLGFHRLDGTVQPKSMAPLGRHRKGEYWGGGQRLGLCSITGQLVTNPLGPSLCSTDAWKAHEFPPPVDYGNDWSFLERKIAERMQGGHSRFVRDEKTGKKTDRVEWVPDQGVTAGPDGKGLQLLPEDLAGCRHLRGLIDDLARRVPAFGVRRDAAIETAKAAAEADLAEIRRMVAGPALDGLKTNLELTENRLAESKKKEAASSLLNVELEKKLARSEVVAADATAMAEGATAKIRNISSELSQTKLHGAEAVQRIKDLEYGAKVLFTQTREFAKQADHFFNLAAKLAEPTLLKAIRGLEESMIHPDRPLKDFDDVLVTTGSFYQLSPAQRELAQKFLGHVDCPSAQGALEVEQLVANDYQPEAERNCADALSLRTEPSKSVTDNLTLDSS
jgi:hypothetical protein